ncbi:DUF4402 domain-containing protein [Enterovibrio norvegicus]|uniref:DUF4402 domain-containing protein n=1 Tax=Enterovibrio norvegicus TaxID=188144 RepID=UPI001F53A777|nr:DUF4402 domain-containing protein [Enterovibrio norvegicus]
MATLLGFLLSSLGLCRHINIFKSRVFILFVFSVTSLPCFSLCIVPERMKLEFSGLYVTGINQKAKSTPFYNRVDVARFYVEGKPGKNVVVTIPHRQFLYKKVGRERLKINRFVYGCGLSKRGSVRIRANGRTPLLCIGAVVKIHAKNSAGRYSSAIRFEVNYK